MSDTSPGVFWGEALSCYWNFMRHLLTVYEDGDEPSAPLIIECDNLSTNVHFDMLCLLH